MTKLWLPRPRMPIWWRTPVGIMAGQGGVAGAWATLTNITATGDSSGWSGYNIRDVSEVAHYAGGAPATGSKIRITVAAASITQGAQFDFCYVGHQAAAGDAYDFDGNQVQMLFNGGSAGATLAIGATLLSDEVNFAFNKTKDLIVSTHFNAGSSIRTGTNTGHNYHWSNVIAADTTDVTIADASTNVSGFCLKIEVFG